MDYQSTTELQEYLDRNERLIWTGQPKKGFVFRTADAFLIPFSILWCGFAVFWFVTALMSGGAFFALFGVPFVLMGLVFVFGRFFIDARQRAHTFYGLTEDRILIKSGVYKTSITSFNIKTLAGIEYTEKRDGSGTIVIGPKNPMAVWGNGMTWWPGAKVAPSFDMIPDVRKVYNKIVELQKERQQSE